jgi:cytochrome c oxidase assembly factor CtaG
VKLFEHLALLAPVIVLAVGAVAALVVIWSRVGWESLQRNEHPWRVVALVLGFVALIAVLSALGVKLPRE